MATRQCTKMEKGLEKDFRSYCLSIGCPKETAGRIINSLLRSSSNLERFVKSPYKVIKNEKKDILRNVFYYDDLKIIKNQKCIKLGAKSRKILDDFVSNKDGEVIDNE